MGAHSRLVKSNESRLKKRFGQHFLRDTGVLERIVRWIQPAPDDLFWDLGAGDGALSTRLAEKAARLIAVEIDVDCIPTLIRALEHLENTAIVPGDMLQLDFSELASRYQEPARKMRFAGNLPYNIATAIIERLLHSRLPVQDMHFMVQLEVAQRITARPGTRQYGYLSVACQHYADVQIGFKVSPACFVPRPKVASAMISLRPKPGRRDPVFESKFEALAKAAFAYRRKTLENSMHRDPELGALAHELLNRAGIQGSRGAEELSVREFEHLAQVLLDL